MNYFQLLEKIQKTYNLKRIKLFTPKLEQKLGGKNFRNAENKHCLSLLNAYLQSAKKAPPID